MGIYASASRAHLRAAPRRASPLKLLSEEEVYMCPLGPLVLGSSLGVRGRNLSPVKPYARFGSTGEPMRESMIARGMRDFAAPAI